MADLLSNKNNKKFLAMVFFGFVLYHSFIQPFCLADFSLDDFPTSNIIAPFGSNFTGQMPIRKKELSFEEKEAMRLARQKLESKKIPCTAQEFIKQVKKNKIDNIKLMLDAGISPNSDYYGEYALYYAARKNKTEAAILLLENGASPDAGFNSPLWWATKNNNKELAQALINHKAKLDYTDLVSSKTILYMAIEKKHYEIAKMLIQNGAKIGNKTAALIDAKKLYNILDIQKF